MIWLLLVYNFTIIEIVKQNCAYTEFSQPAEVVVNYTLEWHQMWFNLQLKTVPNKFPIYSSVINIC